MQIIRWGIVGLGNIAAKFASDLQQVPHCVLQGVASQREGQAKVFAKRFKAQRFYDSYEALLKDEQVDAVYIATLHPSHAHWSLMALRHKKAVLCEKPLAMNGQEVAKMLAEAKAQGVFLMEALWTRFNPLFKQVLKWIEQGEIGTLQYINASFSFYALDRPADSRILDPKKGGGSLLDIGIYPLFLAYQCLGMPQNLVATAILSNQKIDLQTSMILSYPNAQAVLYSGLTHDEEMGAKICGDKGEIYLPSRWHETNRAILKQGEQETIVELPFVGKGYSYEIEETNSCLRKGQLESEYWTHQDSKNLMFLLDEVRKNAGIQYPDIAL
ncbi:MAG: Gfo/Idh/MocA family protein [Flavobacteriaceae bacterium]